VDLSAGMGGSGAMASQEERPPVQDQPLAKPPPTAAEVSAAKAAKQKLAKRSVNWINCSRSIHEPLMEFYIYPELWA